MYVHVSLMCAYLFCTCMYIHLYVGDLKYLYGLSLTGNPLERPPEYIVKKGTKVH